MYLQYVLHNQCCIRFIHRTCSLSLYDILCSERTSADELHTKVGTCTSSFMCSMCSVYLTNDPNMTLFQSEKCVEDFLALGRHEGYQKRHVTSYMHDAWQCLPFTNTDQDVWKFEDVQWPKYSCITSMCSTLNIFTTEHKINRSGEE